MTTLRPELLDELLADYETPEDLLGDEGLFKQLEKALLERALGAELTEHLGYEKGDPSGRGTGNSRNDHSGKTVSTEDGSVDLSVSRDRKGSFEPLIVPKGDRETGKLRAALLQLDQADLRVDEDDDGDGELQVANGGKLAQDHLQSRVAHGRDYRAFRLGKLAADGQRHRVAHRAERG